MPKDEEPKIDSEESMNNWYNKGYFDGPCGWTYSKDLDELPPPTTAELINGSEKVIEFDLSGKIINQWAMPVDSYVYAISGQSIYVSWGKSALEISPSGKLTESSQKYIEPKMAQCPAKIKAIFGNSSYVRCTEHADIVSKLEAIDEI